MAAVKELMKPFRVAMSGVVHTFRTQRHMRIHLYVTLATILGAILLQLRMREVLILLFMITIVLVAEMFNSAIEATVDLAAPSYHPLAKFAKDISAGAVLITTVLAVVVGVLIAIGDDNWERIKLNLTGQSTGVPLAWRIMLGSAAVFFLVIVGKGLGKRGSVLQGGLVSGHSAFGFFFATALVFLTDNAVASGLAIILACIIAQSRWEAKIHSIFELVLGGAVGTILGVLLFGIMPK
jgi:diacylglycerol kinase (ATP)